MLELDHRQAELRERVHWLIRLRWLAALGVSYSASTVLWLEPVSGASRWPHPALPILAMGLVIAAYNVLFFVLARRLERGGAGAPRATAILANVQIVVDLFALVLLLHLAGGVNNPFSFFFVFHMIIASILLSRRAAFAQAALACGLYWGMVELEARGVLAHHELAALRHVGHFGSELDWVPCLVLTLTLFLSVWMATAITERLRRREQERADLMAEVREKAAQLERAYADLETAQEIQTQYMRRVAHELRAPLGAISSLLSVVSEGLTGKVPAKQSELVGRAETRVGDMLRLVDDLLTLSRSRHGAMTTHVEPVDLGDVIQSVTGLQRARAEAAGVALHVDVPDLMPPVCADAEGLTQVMSNLLANAIKYTPDGGEARVTAQVEDGDIVVRVADTGIGIAEEDLPRIFDEFYRTHRARQYQRVGTGLGLAIAKSIVAALNGTIDVTSEEDVGTEFCVRLPSYSGDSGEAVE